MPRIIVKLRDRYLEWSTVVDAPITYGMTRERMKTHLVNEALKREKAEAEVRLQLADVYGSSARESAEDVMALNRAGENESKLTPDEMYEKYCSPKALAGAASRRLGDEKCVNCGHDHFMFFGSGPGLKRWVCERCETKVQ